MDRIDVSVNSNGCFNGGDCAEVYESLQLYKEAIIAAEADIRNWPTNPLLQVQQHMAIGRCQVKLGQVQAATDAFEAAIAEAHRCELPFLEMLARRDYIVYVLDKQGKRSSQMAALGRAISKLALPGSEYTATLGPDIDPEEAIRAFQSPPTL